MRLFRSRFLRPFVGCCSSVLLDPTECPDRHFSNRHLPNESSPMPLQTFILHRSLSALVRLISIFSSCGSWINSLPSDLSDWLAGSNLQLSLKQLQNSSSGWVGSHMIEAHNAVAVTGGYDVIMMSSPRPSRSRTEASAGKAATASGQCLSRHFV